MRLAKGGSNESDDEGLTRFEGGGEEGGLPEWRGHTGTMSTWPVLVLVALAELEAMCGVVGGVLWGGGLVVVVVLVWEALAEGQRWGAVLAVCDLGGLLWEVC